MNMFVAVAIVLMFVSMAEAWSFLPLGTGLFRSSSLLSSNTARAHNDLYLSRNRSSRLRRYAVDKNMAASYSAEPVDLSPSDSPMGHPLLAALIPLAQKLSQFKNFEMPNMMECLSQALSQAPQSCAGYLMETFDNQAYRTVNFGTTGVTMLALPFIKTEASVMIIMTAFFINAGWLSCMFARDLFRFVMKRVVESVDMMRVSMEGYK